MPRPKNSKALQLVARDDAPPPPDWKPDKFETYFGGPIGNIYHTAQGYKRLGFGATAGIPPKPAVAIRAVLEFLASNDGWHSSAEISARINMKAGNAVTSLRLNGKIQGEKKGNVYIYSRIENK
jgi:hypothetical protein